MNVGQNNFDEIRYEYYRDATVLLEAFKSDRLDFGRRTAPATGRSATTFPRARKAA